MEEPGNKKDKSVLDGDVSPTSVTMADLLQAIQGLKFENEERLRAQQEEMAAFMRAVEAKIGSFPTWQPRWNSSEWRPSFSPYGGRVFWPCDANYHLAVPLHGAFLLPPSHHGDTSRRFRYELCPFSSFC